MGLSPDTPHKIQTPNVKLARKFVASVRSETHIKPASFLGGLFDRIPVSGVSCSLLPLPSGM